MAPLRREIDSSLIPSLQLFPIAQAKTSFNLLNISYLKLSVLPTLHVPLSPDSITSLGLHLFLVLSDQERSKLESTVGNRGAGVIIDLKRTISAMFFKGARLGLPHIFCLSCPTSGDYALIFVNDLKLDLTSQSIVADACVIPLNERNSPVVSETMSRSSKQDMTTFSTLDDETRAWRLLLPAFVERCRTWQHGDLCEYRMRGIPACSMDDNTTSPLCSCGLGKDLGAFAGLDDWKAIQSEATRVAISPLFPLLPLQKSFAEISRSEDPTKIYDCSFAENVCAECGGSGQPKLLVCSRCKKVQYCSQKCQKAHWKQHKAICVAMTR